MPAEGLISVLYWGLRAYDPALLVPPDPRFQIPLPLDLSLCVEKESHNGSLKCMDCADVNFLPIVVQQSCDTHRHPVVRLSLPLPTLLGKVTSMAAVSSPHQRIHELDGVLCSEEWQL